MIAVATEGNESIRDLAEHVLYLPRIFEPELQAALAVLPLRRLDAPRPGVGSTSTSRGNLAKTVYGLE